MQRVASLDQGGLHRIGEDPSAPDEGQPIDSFCPPRLVDHVGGVTHVIEHDWDGGYQSASVP